MEGREESTLSQELVEFSEVVRRANQGIAKYQFLVGKEYLKKDSKFVKHNEMLAWDGIQKAAENGESGAQHFWGYHLLELGEISKGLSWIHKAAEGEDPLANYFLGTSIYMDGYYSEEGYAINYDKANQYLRKAYQLNHPDAEAAWVKLNKAMLDEIRKQIAEGGGIELFDAYQEKMQRDVELRMKKVEEDQFSLKERASLLNQKEIELRLQETTLGKWEKELESWQQQFPKPSNSSFEGPSKTIAALKTELNNLKQQMSTKQRALERTEQQLRAAEQVRNQIHEERTLLLKDREGITNRELMEAKKREQVLLQELNQKGSENQELKQRLTNLRKEISALEKEAAENRALKLELDQLKKADKEAEDADKRRREIAGYQKRISSLEEKILELETDSEKLEQEAKTKEEFFQKTLQLQFPSPFLDLKQLKRLSKNVNINKRKKDTGKTQLHYAAEQCDVDQATWLLEERNANPHIKNHRGLKPSQCIPKQQERKRGPLSRLKGTYQNPEAMIKLLQKYAIISNPRSVPPGTSAEEEKKKLEALAAETRREVERKSLECIKNFIRNDEGFKRAFHHLRANLSQETQSFLEYYRRYKSAYMFIYINAEDRDIPVYSQDRLDEDRIWARDRQEISTAQKTGLNAKKSELEERRYAILGKRPVLGERDPVTKEPKTIPWKRPVNSVITQEEEEHIRKLSSNEKQQEIYKLEMEIQSLNIELEKWDFYREFAVEIHKRTEDLRNIQQLRIHGDYAKRFYMKLKREVHQSIREEEMKRKQTARHSLPTLSSSSPNDNQPQKERSQSMALVRNYFASRQNTLQISSQQKNSSSHQVSIAGNTNDNSKTSRFTLYSNIKTGESVSNVMIDESVSFNEEFSYTDMPSYLMDIQEEEYVDIEDEEASEKEDENISEGTSNSL